LLCGFWIANLLAVFDFRQHGRLRRGICCTIGDPARLFAIPIRDSKVNLPCIPTQIAYSIGLDKLGWPQGPEMLAA
jgi:hypothetical protein